MSNMDGSSLFIVDNGVTDWYRLAYLKQWCEIARSIDIATGNFEIGALLELDGQWQRLDKVRILMGEETTQRSKRAFALRERLYQIDGSIEQEKASNPFLAGIHDIVEGLRTGRISYDSQTCRYELN